MSHLVQFCWNHLRHSRGCWSSGNSEYKRARILCQWCGNRERSFPSCRNYFTLVRCWSQWVLHTIPVVFPCKLVALGHIPSLKSPKYFPIPSHPYQSLLPAAPEMSNYYPSRNFVQLLSRHPSLILPGSLTNPKCLDNLLCLFPATMKFKILPFPFSFISHIPGKKPWNTGGF